MEVELRRLRWLEQHLDDLGNASPALLGDDPASSVSSSIKALKQEREYLAERVSSKLTAEEREMLYLKWDIPPEGKHRKRLQPVNKLWTDPLNSTSRKVLTQLLSLSDFVNQVNNQSPRKCFNLTLFHHLKRHG